jgi:hypothetical protein
MQNVVHQSDVANLQRKETAAFTSSWNKCQKTKVWFISDIFAGHDARSFPHGLIANLRPSSVTKFERKLQHVANDSSECAQSMNIGASH